MSIVDKVKKGVMPLVNKAKEEIEKITKPKPKNPLDIIVDHSKKATEEIQKSITTQVKEAGKKIKGAIDDAVKSLDKKKK